VSLFILVLWLAPALCVPKISSTSRDQAIFVDQATDTSLSADPVLRKIDRFGQRFQRRCAAQGAVRPVLIAVFTDRRESQMASDLR
jgi:hypothetical protein